MPSRSRAVDGQPPHVGARGQQRLLEADLVLGRQRAPTSPPGSSFITLVRVSSSTSCSAHQSSGWRSASSRSSSPAGSPSSTAGGRRAGRARGRRAGSSRRSPRSRSCSAQRGRRHARRRSSRTSTSRSATGRPRRWARTAAVMASSRPGSSTSSTSSPASMTVSAFGHEAAAAAQHRDDQAALGQLDVGDRSARRPARRRATSSSMISSRSSRRASRCTSP